MAACSDDPMERKMNNFRARRGKKSQTEKEYKILREKESKRERARLKPVGRRNNMRECGWLVG